MTDGMENGLLLGTLVTGKRGTPATRLLPATAIRHGYVAGAPGTGKTTTLQLLAESFSQIGVPILAMDTSGELAGLSQPAPPGPAAPGAPAQPPVVLWDALGTQGHPLRTTIATMPPLLLARLLNLNDTQEAVLTVTLRAAADLDLLLLDTKDLRATLRYAADHAAQISTAYGSVSPQTIGTIQRALLQFEERGGTRFFGEPALDLRDLLGPAPAAPAHINLLNADRSVITRHEYSALVLFLLTQLRALLPETPAAPAAAAQQPAPPAPHPTLLVLIEDAHLIFEDAPAPLIDLAEQLLRALSRRGVGIFLATENPVDLPERILSHLGTRIQHALRDYTPRDERRATAAAELLRPNPSFMTELAITALTPGEALISTLDATGAPCPVERTRVTPPRSQPGAITEEARRALCASSPLAGRYDEPVDRESAYEILKARAEADAAVQAAAAQAAAEAKAALQQARLEAAQARAAATKERAERAAQAHQNRMMEAAGKSAARSIGSQVARQLLRGLLGVALKNGSPGI